MGNTARFPRLHPDHGLYVFGRTSVEMVNNLIWRNGGQGVKIEEEVFPHFVGVILPAFGFLIPLPIPIPTFYPPKATLDYTVWGNGGASVAGSGAFTSLSRSNDFGVGSCRNWASGRALGNCDPAFMDPDSGDYHIKRISPALQAARNIDVGNDIDGESHNQGNLADLGADEYPFRQTRYAAPGGGSGDRCHNYANPCSIQEAIDKAEDGDLIKLAQGTHLTVVEKEGRHQVAYVDRSVTLQGGYCPTDTPVSGVTDCDWEVAYPDQYPTILDAGGAGRAMAIVGEVAPEIFGLRLTGGNAGAAGMDGLGGGLYVAIATATIREVHIVGNTATEGGGAYFAGDDSLVTDVVVANNTARDGAGIAMADGSKTTFLASQFIGNRAEKHGGGAYLQGSAGQFIGNRVDGNQAGLSGGGLFLAGGTAEVKENAVTDNRAASGGGLHLDAGGSQVIGNTVIGNEATLGGGLHLHSSEGKVQGNTVADNRATEKGGGFFIHMATIGVEANTVSGNQAVSGGGFYLLAASEASLTGNTVTANVAGEEGGGLALESSPALLSANVIMGNTARGGAGIHLASFSAASEGGASSGGGLSGGDGDVVISRKAGRLWTGLGEAFQIRRSTCPPWNAEPCA